MVNDHQVNGPTIYQIRVKGVLDPQWSDWFDGFSISSPQKGQTLLSGPVVDQAALYGILAKINDLGLQLLSVELEGEFK
jgi:hypothetical protein